MPQNAPQPANGPLPAAPLSWPILLARWTQFAQAAIALPEVKEGAAWKASVESIIALQAVTFALGDLMLLPTAERPLAVDRAGVLLARHEEALQAAWQGQDVPAAVAEVLADATAAYQAAKALLSRQ